MKAQRINSKKPKQVKIAGLEVTLDSTLDQIKIKNPQQNITYTIYESRGMLTIMKLNEFDLSDEFIIKPVVSNHIKIH